MSSLNSVSDNSDFVDRVTDAYGHLYDLVYLRTHPLTDQLFPQPALTRKEKAWQLHTTLLEILEELDPGADLPAYAHDRRLFRLVSLHYVDGLDPDSTADRLGISRRQYYREHKRAMEAVGQLLLDRFQQEAQPAETHEATTPVDVPRLELLRREAARLAQAGRQRRLDDVVRRAVPLLQSRLAQHHSELVAELPRDLPAVLADEGAIRQGLLATLGYLIERTRNATLRIGARIEPSGTVLSIAVEPPVGLDADFDERLRAFEEMSSLGGAEITPLRGGQELLGFEMRFPTRAPRSILVVDDNEDMLELFSRFLTPHGYRVVTARSAADALKIARRVQPYVIILDLMIPGQDGWDLLQNLLSHTETQSIPKIVCSVLKQKELALSLGANAFLEKPLSETELISTLTLLEAP